MNTNDIIKQYKSIAKKVGDGTVMYSDVEAHIRNMCEYVKKEAACRSVNFMVELPDGVWNTAIYKLPDGELGFFLPETREQEARAFNE
jgi:hypothetical protein